VPTFYVLSVRRQIRPRLAEFVIEIQVDMMCLQVHDYKHGGYGAGELAESVVDVSGLQRHIIPESVNVNLGG
jgi:hypothetical protein